MFCIAVPFGTCRQRNRGKIGKTDTQNTKSYRLETTGNFSLLPLPLLQTRCQTLALLPEQQAFACRRLPIRHIQNACVLPTDFGQTLKRQLSAHLRNSLTSKKFCAERMQRQGNSQKNLPHRGKIFSQIICYFTSCLLVHKLCLFFTSYLATHKLFLTFQAVCRHTIVSIFANCLVLHNCFYLQVVCFQTTYFNFYKPFVCK